MKRRRRVRLMVGVLYVLVYWGNTGFYAAIGLSVALGWAGAPRPLTIGAAALAIMFASFNLGLTVGLGGPPPGKRR